MLRVYEIGKEYDDKIALNGIDLTFPDKGLVIIKGESGSGKTTLLNLLTAHDYPTSGKITFDGVEINTKNSEKYRKAHCSNIYQDYMLIEDMTVGENIELALQAYGARYTSSDVEELLSKVGIPREYITKQASKMSGGEKQRVSIARAIAKDNAMVFADEPTGNLDSQNGEIVMEILKEISKERLVVVVSHNEVFNVKYADYTVELVDGVVESSNLPQIEEEREEEKGELYKSKSKLKFKELIKLSSWGFKKNRAKSVVSIIAFMVFCLLSLTFTVLSFADMNYALAKSFEKCERKNFITGFVRDDRLTYRGMEKFEEKLNNECSKIFKLDYSASGHSYKYYFGEEDSEAANKFNAAYEISSSGKGYCYPNIDNQLIYNPKIGMDVEVLYGDFPKEYHEVMLPYCFAKYMAVAYVDYKCDDVKDLIGKEIKYGAKEDSAIKLKICGIFEEGEYFTDFDKPQSKEVVEYYRDNNMLASCAVFHPDIYETWLNDAWNSNLINFSNYLYFKNKDDRRIMHDLDPCGYDRFSEYAKQYPPLKEGEIYIGKRAAQILNLQVGDTVLDTQFGDMVTDMDIDFSRFVIKDIFEIPGNLDFVMFPSDYFVDTLVKAKNINSLKGFYFNLKGKNDVYGYLNKVAKTGHQEKIWWEFPNCMDTAYTGNISVIPQFYYSLIDAWLYMIPLAVISMIGMLTMAFVSVSYLLASKGNSYNTLRSLGFGKGHIGLILAVQTFIMIGIGLILAVSICALGCHIFSNTYIKSELGTVAKLSTEVLLPMGFKAPLIVIGVSILLGLAIVFAKTVSIYRKSIAENKQSE